MSLHELAPPAGARRLSRRKGRGLGSGRGTTAGKGTKGQKARSGGGVPPYFEGGQLPLVKKLPYRRGFQNPSRVEYRPVNLRDLDRFEAGSTIDPAALLAAGLIRDLRERVKLLGVGEVDRALHVKVHRASESARSKIQAAGGSCDVIEHAPSVS
ncbi:MAG: 50S ribosomal protein L15 [Chloroflexota bacterium]